TAPPPRSARGSGSGRSLLIAVLSTVLVFAALGFLAVNAPGWDRVRNAFLDGENFTESAPGIIAKFGTNIALFLIAEVLILGFALCYAVVRSLSGPGFFPLRVLATIYADVFRALPGVLVIYVLGFGIPGLRMP